MKVLLLGSTGMLGCGVSSAFEGESDFEVHRAYRDSEAFNLLSNKKNGVKFDCEKDDLGKLLDRVAPDCVINCIGVIKPFISKSIESAIYINSIFPHKIASVCESKNIKSIHITTDCVYTGNTGAYTEKDPHDEQDIYGRSKSLGEPSNCMVVRTSIIGEEIHKKASLVEWVKSSKNGNVNGFTDHLWNGITTKQFGKACISILKNNWYEHKKRHVFTPGAVNKYELLGLLNDRFKLNLNIAAVSSPRKVDRTLATTEDLSSKLKIPTLKEQLNDI